MVKELTKEEKFVRKELEKVWPQLQINEKKILGSSYELYGGDLMAVAVEFFLNKPIQQQLDTIKQGKLENFITFIANLQAKSSSTKFYIEYKRPTLSMREYYPDSYLYDHLIKDDNSDDDVMLCIKQAIRQLNPFEKMIVENRIIKGMSYDDIVEQYDIPYSSISNELTKVKKKLKKLCKHLKL